MKINEHMKEARTSRGMTRAELSRRSGLWRNSIEDYESGKMMPTLSNAMYLATALGISLSEFMTGIPVMHRDIVPSYAEINASTAKHRIAKNMTVAQLSKASGVYRLAIDGLEKDFFNVGAVKVLRLADALDISIDEYIGRG